MLDCQDPGNERIEFRCVPGALFAVCACLKIGSIDEYPRADILKQRRIGSFGYQYLYCPEFERLLGDLIALVDDQRFDEARRTAEKFPQILIQYVESDLLWSNPSYILAPGAIVGSWRVNEIVILLEDPTRNITSREFIGERLRRLGFATAGLTRHGDDVAVAGILQCGEDMLVDAATRAAMVILYDNGVALHLFTDPSTVLTLIWVDGRGSAIFTLALSIDITQTPILV